jgi:HSP20 family protein
MHQEMGRLFSETEQGALSSEFPALNIWSKENDLFVSAEVSGVDPKDLDVSVSGDVLTLRGERKEVVLNPDEEWLRRERPAGKFVRTLQLPFQVEPNKTEARFRDGVLAISLTRLEEEKPKKIEVKIS